MLTTPAKRGDKVAIKKILLAYNFTRLDQKAVDFAIDTFAHLKDVEITIFNAYTPVPEIEAVDTSITGKLKSSMSYLTQQIAQREAELNEVRQMLLQGGYAEGQVNTEFRPRKRDIASEIIESVMLSSLIENTLG
jgi:hypothetical protein